MQLNAGVVDILLSRLFHDLIGPVSATVNGIELVEEFSNTGTDSIGREAMELIGSSAKQSADRLSYFRLAFGDAGNGGEHGLETVRRLADAYLGSRRIPLDFSTNAVDDEKPAPGIVKTILATIFLMADALPRSGTVHVDIDVDLGWTTVITALGPGAAIEDGCIAILTGDDSPARPTTRTVIGVIVEHTAARFGMRPEVESEPDLARITLRPVS